MNRNALIGAIVVIVLLLVIGGYYLSTRSSKSSDGLYSTPTPTSTITPTATVNPTPTKVEGSTTPTPSSAVKEFTVIGNADTFNPNRLTVNKGDTVKITFKATDTTHTFTLPDFSVDTGNVASGQNKTVQFIADKTGSFQFYCTLHKAMGMTGTLVVQ